MCSSTAPSVWNVVEIASRGENRSIAHSSSVSGSSPSNCTESSPASRSSSSSTDTSSLPSRELRELVVGCAIHIGAERLALNPSSNPTADQTDDDLVQLLRRHTAEDRTRNRRRPVEA